MMNAFESKTSEVLSLWQLLKKHKVMIPIMQRDYAQGREGKEKILKSLLFNMKSAIVNGTTLELDFVYGTVSDSGFFPLDGQQRLTTLFLLHWYAAVKEKVDPSVYIPVLKQFTYETRVSSREFCIKLVECKMEVIKNACTSIPDCSWFCESWMKDPTVSGMLRTIDAIEKNFDDVERIWDRLVDEENPAVSFILLKLEDFGLSDDLYIKMNARGKELTAYESFKAIMEAKIDEEKWDREYSPEASFSMRADNKWTEFFWREAEDDFDRAFLQFISNTLICSMASEEKRKAEKRILDLFNDPDEMTPDDFKKHDYVFMYKTIDIFSGLQMEKLDLSFPLWDLPPENQSVFRMAIGVDATYKQRALFFAQAKYLLENTEVERESYVDWMRVVRNVVHNVVIDSAERFSGALILLDELSKGCKDIYSYLHKSRVRSRFAQEQVEEERTKAVLIAASNNSKEMIHNVEDTNLCQGRIAFALYAAQRNEHEHSIDFQKLAHIADVFNRHFSRNEFSDWIRGALLTIQDGSYYKHWRSWLVAVNAPKYYLISTTDDMRGFANNRDFRSFLKELVEKLIEKSPEQIVSDYVPTEDLPAWKIRLIKNPTLLELSTKKYIAVDEEKGKCYLIPGKRVENSDRGRNRLFDVDDLHSSREGM